MNDAAEGAANKSERGGVKEGQKDRHTHKKGEERARTAARPTHTTDTEKRRQKSQTDAQKEALINGERRADRGTQSRSPWQSVDSTTSSYEIKPRLGSTR